MACDDVRDAHIIEAYKLAQIQVPNEVAVLGGNNNDMICELTSPPLSSIALDIHKAGQQPAMCPERMMSGKKIIEQNIMVEPNIVNRPVLGGWIMANLGKLSNKSWIFVMNGSLVWIHVIKQSAAIKLCE